MKLAGLIAVSLLLHAAGGWWLAGHRREPRVVRPRGRVEIHVKPAAVEEVKPVQAVEPAAAAPPPARRQRPTARRVLVAAAGAQLPASAPVVAPPPAEAPPAPVDFTEGPVVVAPVAAGPAAVVAKARPAPAVPLADLSRPPSPPALDGELLRRYPEAARAAGRAGRAAVRVRVEADGRARVLTVVTASEAPFGEACRRTVDGSHWRPPLDPRGTAVATEVTYTCDFEVGGL